MSEKAARVGTYNVWDYAEGQDSYRSLMLVDLTRPPEEVSNVSSISPVVNGLKIQMDGYTGSQEIGQNAADDIAISRA